LFRYGKSVAKKACHAFSSTAQVGLIQALGLMKPSHDQHNDFLARRPISGIYFGHNDAVEVVGGDFVGDSGSVVSIEDLSGDPLYLIELSSGQDALISQSSLRLVEA
jgi:hypothetical protein